MHARPALRHALILAPFALTWPLLVQADNPVDRPSPPPQARKSGSASAADPRGADAGNKPISDKAATPPPALPKLPAQGEVKPMPIVASAPAVAVVTPGSLAEAGRTRAGTEARIKELDAPDKKDDPATKPIREILDRRMKLLDVWKEAARKRDEAEHPNPSPEQVAAEFKADLEKTRALLDQANKAPHALLPEAFGPLAPGAEARPVEARLTDMKEAIDTARQELKERSAELEKLRTEGSKGHAGEVATLRSERDKVHQSMAALIAGRAEREAAIANAGSPEARELARDKFTNYEWECRVDAENLARLEAQITLAAKRAELGSFQVQAKAGHVDLDRRLVDLMEKQYASQSEMQQTALKQAVVKEESKAAHTADILERYRAKRSAELLELEAQAVAYEKAAATTPPGLSERVQSDLADEAGSDFEKLKRLLADGNVSPLDVLRLKNGFRRIGPLRASIVHNELAAIKGQLTTYENALADVEVDLVNDARDDRYDRESLLDKLPEKRHHEAEAVLATMEARHLALLNRLRTVLQTLAERAESTQTQIHRRMAKLDEQYAFIRTHIFWVRDAEPVGPATLDHAGEEAVRTVRALVRLGCEIGDKSLWGRIAPDFILALIGMVVLPWPLRLGQKALDRLRLATPDPSLTAATPPSPTVG